MKLSCWQIKNEYWHCPIDQCHILSTLFNWASLWLLKASCVQQNVRRTVTWCPEQGINWRAGRIKPSASESSWRACQEMGGLCPGHSRSGRGHLRACLLLSPACPLQRKHSCKVLSPQQWGEMDERLFHHLFLCPNAPLRTGEQASTVFWRLQEEVAVVNPTWVIPSGVQRWELETPAGKPEEVFDPRALVWVSGWGRRHPSGSPFTLQITGEFYPESKDEKEEEPGSWWCHHKSRMESNFVFINRKFLFSQLKMGYKEVLFWNDSLPSSSGCF